MLNICVPIGKKIPPATTNPMCTMYMLLMFLIKRIKVTNVILLFLNIKCRFFMLCWLNLVTASAGQVHYMEKFFLFNNYSDFIYFYNKNIYRF